MKTYVALLVALFSSAATSQTLQSAIQLAATRHKIDASLLQAIAKVESNDGVYRLNSRTHDFGAFQLNRRTITAMGLDENRIYIDDAYAADAAARLLKSYRASHRPNWECMYNVGYQQLPKLCAAYMFKLETAGYVKKSQTLLSIAATGR